MVRYIDDHKGRFGVEPICAVLPIAPSTYYEQKARERELARRPARAIRDEQLKPEIQRVFDRTSASTARTRSGSSSSAKGSRSLVARSSG
jgi:hypothetical protein